MRVPKEEYIEVEHVGKVVPWEVIKRHHTEAEWIDFQRWIGGQTCVADGCYDHDYERWLRTL